jgi:acyl-CoA dehydrogenase family protein 9
MLRYFPRVCCAVSEPSSHRVLSGRWRKYGTAQAENFTPDESRGRHGSAVSEQQHSSTSAVTEHGKPLKNKPFIKNLFMGQFDTNMLIFPEILSKHEVEELNHMYEPVKRFYLEKVDSKAIDEQHCIPDEILQQLKDFGLFGQQIPHEYGGLGFNATQYARMAEATSLDASLAVTLGAHQSIGLKGILLFGTEEQKAKYLPKLATGEHIAAFCLTEATSGSDAASIQTRATLSDDGRTFFINGEKLWISNGGFADIFTVFAKTKITLPTGQSEDKVTAFIVERAFGGITSGKPEDKLGMCGSNTCAVHFENTPVPIENVIGEVGHGFKVAVSILNSGRFSMGSASAGALRQLLAQVSEHAIHRKQFGRPIKDFGLIQLKFANMAMDVYAMESISYVTAGIIDSYQYPDASVEAAIVKVFSSEALWLACSESLQIMGGLGYMRNYPFERYLRDCRIASIFEGTNEILRLFIALTGLQHAGLELRDMVKRLRDPLNNVGFAFKKAFERIRTNRTNPSLNLELYNHVHPDLSQCGESLEVRIIRFKYVIEKYLSSFGDKIVEEQLALKRIADIVIDFYAITGVLARASRSKSVGLQHHDHEIMLAKAFVANACKRIDRNLSELDEGKYVNGDESIRHIAETIFKHGGYTATHPLTRNW